jgi:hypothetical protein
VSGTSWWEARSWVHDPTSWSSVAVHKQEEDGDKVKEEISFYLRKILTLDLNRKKYE